MKISVFIESITYHFVEDRLFEPLPTAVHYHQPWVRIRERLAPFGIEVHTADFLTRGLHSGDLNLYFSMGNVSRYKQLARRSDVVLSALFQFEAPIVHPSVYRGTPEAARYFRRVYSFSNPRALAQFHGSYVPVEKFCIPQPFESVFDDLWDRGTRKFLTMISQNKLPVRYTAELYTERLRALEYFSTVGEIDLYGIGWDQMPFVVGERFIPQQLIRVYRSIRHRVPIGRLHPYEEVIKKVYKGRVASKYEKLSEYTFALCYENMVLDGWVNEKIFDAFLAGTIPIYLGAPDITDYVPEECFIDMRRFASYGELREFLRSLSPPEIQTYRENAREYLGSPMYRPFTSDAFADLFVRGVNELSPVDAEAVPA